MSKKRLDLASNCIDSDVARPLVDDFIDYLSLEQLNLGYMKATILLGGLDNVIEDEAAAEISRLILHLMSYNSGKYRHNEKTKEENNKMIEQNKIEWDIQVLSNGIADSSPSSKSEYLQKVNN
ncbi:unnamed protein product [Rotaria sordida]|uniref:Uncharacterized protein n=1 Tax=Rotaria sordida TaxID=392033 RepID=A0A815YU92_9BILA|nr:unnamed protein product [Rotaria sordida]CAF1575790.1 unnamed protein product [Rotaria sordida]